MNQPSDQSQNISVGGDFTLTAHQSVVNLRDILGTVNTTIDRIPTETSPQLQQLQQLLQELTTAIELEASLDEEEKAEAANKDAAVDYRLFDITPAIHPPLNRQVK